MSDSDKIVAAAIAAALLLWLIGEIIDWFFRKFIGR